MDKELKKAEEAISKIENSLLLTGEIIRLGIALGIGNKIESVESSTGKCKVTLDDGTSHYFC